MAPVHEVFASIQGEGHHVGEPQVFLRLAGCPLRCAWCDTPAALEVPTGYPAADGGAERTPWASPFRAAVWIADADPGGTRSVSVTGGEPLLWPEFLGALRGFVGPRRLHLETAGVPVESLARVRDVFDHVSLDLKLPADLLPPEPPRVSPDGAARAGAPGPYPHDEESWSDARRGALELVRGRDACAKIVVAGGRPARAFRPLLDDLFELAPELPLYLQPVSPVAGVQGPSRDELEALVQEALERELRVRVVPQVHRMLRIP